MITHNDKLHLQAKNVLSEKEVEKMEHCIGYRPEKVYRRSGSRYFKPYRNYFYPGGTDAAVWEGLKEKGFADCGDADKNGHRTYWLNHSGMNVLSAYKRVFIYSDSANGNEIDAQYDVLKVLLDDAVFCGYGCWMPSGARSIALRARLPLKLTLSTLKYLKDKCGYAAHVYEGGADDEGFPHCTHGWTLTKKWTDEHPKEYEAAIKTEYARLDAQM